MIDDITACNLRSLEEDNYKALPIRLFYYLLKDKSMFASRVEKGFYFSPGHWPSGVFFSLGQALGSKTSFGPVPCGQKTPLFYPRGEITILSLSI